MSRSKCDPMLMSREIRIASAIFRLYRSASASTGYVRVVDLHSRNLTTSAMRSGASAPTGEWLFGIPSFGRALSVESWRSPKQHRDRNCRRTSIPLLPPQVCLGHSTASSSSVLGLPRAICSSVEPPGQCTNVVGDKMHCGLRCWRSSWLKTWAHHSQSARRNY